MREKKELEQMLHGSHDLANRIAACCEDQPCTEVIGALTFVLAYALIPLPEKATGEVLRSIRQFVDATRRQEQ